MADTPKQQDDSFIVKRTDYFNQHGMHVEHREIHYVDKDLAKDFTPNHVEFVGHGAIPVQDQDGNPDQIPFEFGIAASNLKDAFRRFRVACTFKGEALKKEIHAEQAKLKADAPRIITT